MSKHSGETNDRPLVVAISGQPGAGKTTISRLLASRLPASRYIAYDDYQSVTALSYDAIDRWFQRGGDCNDFDLSALAAELGRRGRERDTILVILETPFGRQHAVTARHIDLVVWIDTPFDMALARNIDRFVEQALERRQPPEDFLRWLQTYLGYYKRSMARMFRQQSDDVRPNADFVVDGMAHPDEIAASITDFLTQRSDRIKASIRQHDPCVER